MRIATLAGEQVDIQANPEGGLERGQHNLWPFTRPEQDLVRAPPIHRAAALCPALQPRSLSRNAHGRATRGLHIEEVAREGTLAQLEEARTK
jgi:hypothetical protein